jgi:hypothetical protein
MSPDDIDRIALEVFDLLTLDLGYDLTDNHYDYLVDLLHDKLEPFVTRDRNYN